MDDLNLAPASFRPHSAVGQRLKPRRTLQKGQLNSPGWAISLFADNEFCYSIEFGIVRLVNFLAKDACHHVGVLLDRAGFPKVGKLRTVIAGSATFWRPT